MTRKPRPTEPFEIGSDRTTTLNGPPALRFKRGKESCSTTSRGMDKFALQIRACI